MATRQTGAPDPEAFVGTGPAALSGLRVFRPERQRDARSDERHGDDSLMWIISGLPTDCPECVRQSCSAQLRTTGGRGVRGGPTSGGKAYCFRGLRRGFRRFEITFNDCKNEIRHQTLGILLKRHRAA